MSIDTTAPPTFTPPQLDEDGDPCYLDGNQFTPLHIIKCALKIDDMYDAVGLLRAWHDGNFPALAEYWDELKGATS